MLAELTRAGAHVRSGGDEFFVKLDVRMLSPENVARLSCVRRLGYILIDGATESDDDLLVLSQLGEKVMIEIRGARISSGAVSRLQAVRPNSIVSRESATSPRGLVFPLASVP